MDDTNDFRLYAAGIRTVDGVSQARLFAAELSPVHAVIRWSVKSSNGTALGGSTFRVELPNESTVAVKDNGPLDADPDDGAFLLVDRRTRHAVATVDRPSPDALVYTNREFPRREGS